VNHDSYSDAYIGGILTSCRTFAFVGASPTQSRPSYFAMKYLMAKGYRVIPVNPGHAGKQLLGQKIYASLAEIEEPVDVVDMFRTPDAAPEIVREAIAIGEQARIPVQISHIKLGTVGVWRRAAAAVALIENARKRGVDVTADCYPYNAWSSTITVLVPDKRYDHPPSVEKALADVGGAGNVLIVRHAAHPDYEFKTLDAVARSRGVTPVEQFIQIVRDGGAGVVCTSMVEDDIRAFYRQFAVDAGSDPPILIYRTEAMELETAIELWQSGRLAGVVDATGDSDDYERLVSASVPVLTGDDAVAARCGGRFIQDHLGKRSTEGDVSGPATLGPGGVIKDGVHASEAAQIGGQAPD